MVGVISLERAVAEGCSASSVEAMAQWHDDRRVQLVEELKRRPSARKSITKDIDRHKRLGSDLRSLALKFE